MNKAWFTKNIKLNIEDPTHFDVLSKWTLRFCKYYKKMLIKYKEWSKYNNVHIIYTEDLENIEQIKPILNKFFNANNNELTNNITRNMDFNKNIIDEKIYNYIKKIYDEN